MNPDTGGSPAAEEIQTELKLLNQSMINKVKDIVNNNEPTADLWPQLRKANAEYLKSREELVEKMQNPKPEPNDTDTLPEPEIDNGFKHTIPETDIHIMWPLTPALQKDLQMPETKDNVISSVRASAPRKNLQDMLTRGEVIYEYAARAVIRISPSTVVKINKSMDTTEQHSLSHIRRNSQHIPVPEALGMISIGRWKYSFTSFLPGVSLDRVWGNLTVDKKSHVRDQLNHIFTQLRRLPIPSREGCIGGGTPLVCKAGFRFQKASTTPIANEELFNDFLLDDSLLDADRVEYVRANLPSDHDIVYTHGDLCPVNIMVESEDVPNVTGIVDWETAGGYPEYWEYVRAFRSSFNGRNDWYRFLPEKGIGKFFDEFTRCRVIELNSSG